MLDDKLQHIVTSTSFLQEVLAEAEQEFDHYYIGAGCITQTVWNVLSGFEEGYGIKDIDVVYYDAHDLNGEGERSLEKKLRQRFSHIPFSIDVTNEARVHLWYEEKFGKPIRPYQSVEEAIGTWPSTASALGIKKTDDYYRIYAPFGLEDLFNMIVRPNKKMIPKEVYEQKALQWRRRWPDLTVIPW
ncbi:nucleotidyltransferase family protein [Halobacillus andaensis]|uniref:nucleotidyltransferase family protein n=1 Tax=Halobacillus andaensis TaxID=1176239 RepID=UPI003D71A29C